MIMRDEYPRPSFVRDKWQCLNGECRAIRIDDKRSVLSGKRIVGDTFC